MAKIVKSKDSVVLFIISQKEYGVLDKNTNQETIFYDRKAAIDEFDKKVRFYCIRPKKVTKNSHHRGSKYRVDVVVRGSEVGTKD